jgi:hypothetical protein
MLCDRYLDELAETFEAGFAATHSGTATADTTVVADDVRITAWLDGACYNDPTIADSIVSYWLPHGSVLTLH